MRILDKVLKCEICERDAGSLVKVAPGLMVCLACRCVLEQLAAALPEIERRQELGAEIFSGFAKETAEAILRQGGYTEAEITDCRERSIRVRKCANAFWNGSDIPYAKRVKLLRDGFTKSEIDTGWEVYCKEVTEDRYNREVFGDPTYGNHPPSGPRKIEVLR